MLEETPQSASKISKAMSTVWWKMFVIGIFLLPACLAAVVDDGLFRRFSKIRLKIVASQQSQIVLVFGEFASIL